MAKNETVEAVDTSDELVAVDDYSSADDQTALDVLNGRDTSIKAEIRELVTGAPAMYSSIKGDTFEAKRKVLSIVTNSKPVSENLGVKIDLRHIIIQSVTMMNRETGVASEQPRVILIDDKGTAFHAISKGLFLAIRNFIGVLGEPEYWTEPVPIVVKRERATVGHFVTIEIAD